MWLTGDDKRLLHEALVSAFYNVQRLREMVTYRCDQPLDCFTDGTRSSRATRSSSPRASIAAIRPSRHRDGRCRRHDRRQLTARWLARLLAPP